MCLAVLLFFRFAFATTTESAATATATFASGERTVGQEWPGTAQIGAERGALTTRGCRATVR